MQTGQQAQQVMTTASFLQSTRPKSQIVATGTAYQDGASVSIQMPPVGAAYQLLMRVDMSVVVTGTITGGTWKGWPGPAPYSILKRLRFGSNQNIYYRDYSGWGAYKHARYRYKFDPSIGQQANYSSLTKQLLGLTAPGGQTLIQPGGSIAAGTYSGSFFLPIPLAYNKRGGLGLLIFQQNQIFFNLSMDFGQFSYSGSGPSSVSNDLFTGLSGTGSVTVVPTISYSIGYDYFDLVPNMGPLLKYFMSVNEFTPNQVPSGGQNVVQIPQTDYVSMMLLEVMSNASPINTNNFSNVIMSHSGNIYDRQDNYSAKIGRSFWEGQGLPSMDGILDWDLGIRNGNPNMRDTTDVFNDQNITNLQLQYSLSNQLSLTNPTSTCLVEALRPYQTPSGVPGVTGNAL